MTGAVIGVDHRSNRESPPIVGRRSSAEAGAMGEVARMSLAGLGMLGKASIGVR